MRADSGDLGPFSGPGDITPGRSRTPYVRRGGPMYYRGRDMALTHQGMRISERDWEVFLGHAAKTLAKFQVPEAEQRDLVAFVQGFKKEIVE